MVPQNELNEAPAAFPSIPGTRIEQIAPDVWVLNSFFLSLGCKGSLRMTILRTGQELLLYSPVAMTEAEIEAISALGEVSAIVAPNLYHHMFLRPCLAAFPQARVLVPDGLEDKIGAISGAEVMTPETEIEAAGEIALAVFTGHKIRETVLFHRASGTLVTADLLYNYHEEHHRAEKLFFRAINCYGRPKVAFYHRFALSEKAAVSRFLERIGDWPVKRIVMCHGRIIEGPGAGDVFRTAWRGFA